MVAASWRSYGFLTHGMILAFWSQVMAPNQRNLAALGFLLAGLVFVWGLSPGWALIPRRVGAAAADTRVLISDRAVRIAYFTVAAILLVLSFRSFAGNHLALDGVVFWMGGLLCFLMAVWERSASDVDRCGGTKTDATGRRLSWHLVALIGVILLAFVFRFHNLTLTPIEMTSDHAEKLFDVHDVLNGDRPIFFERNTGREALQFYVTALLIKITPLQLSHLALKVGTGIFGVLAIPFTYLLGREIYNRHVGLLAATLMAVSHWHVAITRVGLRFPFTAAFATPVLYFLFRAFRLNRRRDWILVGGFLGIGLHTYIPMRIVPLLLVVLCGVKLIFDCVAARRGLSPRPTGLAPAFWLNAAIGAATSIIIFLPLLRYMTDEPGMFWMRTASRAIPEGMSTARILEVFLDNIKDAALMFNFIGDVVAVNSVGGSPVLGWVTGGLFILGLWYLLWTLVRDGDRRPVYLVICLFVLLLPSTLSIHFPNENPSVVRAGGAPAVVMIIAALPLYVWAVAAHRAGKGLAVVGPLLAPAGFAIVLIGSTAYNYNWYFVRYHHQILGSIWNSRDLGGVIRLWRERGGNPRHAYQIGFPHWVDTRLIGIHAGDIGWHNDLWEPERLAGNRTPAEGKLFLLSPEDTVHLTTLRGLFPNGRWQVDPSSVPGRGMDFVIFEVPAQRPDSPTTEEFLVVSPGRWIRPDGPPTG